VHQTDLLWLTSHRRVNAITQILLPLQLSSSI
jgi:hypothetical protein